MLHAYALLVNTEHTASIPWIGITLGRRFAQYINRTYRRVGTQWDSRFNSSLIQADTYLLYFQCCIELNPARTVKVRDTTYYR